MAQGRTFGIIDTISTWLMRLVVINILWIGTTLAGLVVFGIGPATTASFIKIRGYLTGEKVSYVEAVRRYFLRSVLFSWILLLVGAILVVDYYFLFRWESSLANVFIGLAFFFTIFYLVVVAYGFIYISEGRTIKEAIKQSVIYFLRKPSMVITGLMSIVIGGFIISQLAVLLLFFSFSLGAVILALTFGK
ncbi:DUF624 domain-containing protein [Paenalkalicoccus suaedae]|uniref:DUF624 domain-containing protein n=1 Tax=Paenalkalicoccus suaedae TaxID=2592382 RepID=A0A859FG78_9BACI|nr:DUF624 domain-containing protein [Paenalkalicoccus suaedae]QKS72373.1 DUF624 domain-containing protein [Paenalkalicoccus suaedae]